MKQIKKLNEEDSLTSSDESDSDDEQKSKLPRPNDWWQKHKKPTKEVKKQQVDD